MCVGGGACGLCYGPNKKGVPILEPGYTAECLQKIKRKREEDHRLLCTYRSNQLCSVGGQCGHFRGLWRFERGAKVSKKVCPVPANAG